MRRVTAISAPPRSANPRGRRGLSLLVLSGLSAIIVLHRRFARGSSRLAQRQGTGLRSKKTPSHAASSKRKQRRPRHAIGRSTASNRHPERSRGLLASIHRKPGVQGGAAPHRARQGYALL